MNDDTISRQAAIDALGEKPLAWTEGEYELGLQNQWEHDVDAIRALPPVQPKYNASEWCHDCSEYDQNKHCCPRFNRVIRNAVEEVKKPKTGHWIEYTRILMPEPINKWEQAWYCSECGYGNQECEDGSAWLEWKYCPNCGAEMESEKTE